MIDDVFFLINAQAVMAAALSGIALGWTFTVIRPFMPPIVFLRSATAIGILWYVPATLVRVMDPQLHVNGLRTIGTFALFMAFLAVAAGTIALIQRRQAP